MVAKSNSLTRTRKYLSFSFLLDSKYKFFEFESLWRVEIVSFKLHVPAETHPFAAPSRCVGVGAANSLFGGSSIRRRELCWREQLCGPRKLHDLVDYRSTRLVVVWRSSSMSVYRPHSSRLELSKLCRRVLRNNQALLGYCYTFLFTLKGYRSRANKNRLKLKSRL